MVISLFIKLAVELPQRTIDIVIWWLSIPWRLEDFEDARVERVGERETKKLEALSR